MTKNKKITILVILTLLFSVILFWFKNSNEKAVDVDENNVPRDSTTSYFPEKTFPKIEMRLLISPDKKRPVFPLVRLTDSIVKNEYDTIEGRYTSKILFYLKEPLLYNLNEEKEIYRFTLVSYGAIVVRIENTSKGKMILWKELNVDEKYKPTEVMVSKSKRVSEKDWAKLKLMLNKINFWGIYPNTNVGGFDGSNWILEGIVENKYKAVSFWEPKRKEIEYHNTCKYILSLTDLHISEDL